MRFYDVYINVFVKYINAAGCQRQQQRQQQRRNRANLELDP
jgi:hypothetical protein